MIVQRAEKADAAAVTALLNRVTKRLLDINMMQWDYPWDEAAVIAQIDRGERYILISGDHVIGTFAMKQINEPMTFPVAPGSCYLFELAVEPVYQGQKIGQKLLEEAKLITAGTLYLDCWAGNEKLRDYYTKAGWKEAGVYPVNDYEICVFLTEGGKGD
ncbi:GNAT family N-acetyltransferase [Alkalicoccus luteus]|uniref:GNAT family N-acetyltransferase n=1 Tax=Alkalicoccus luteus TaxID=1237094 RepID=UPI0040335923